MGNALDRACAAQAENEALKVSAQETTAALQETTAELQDLKGELKWLQLHTKREQDLARDPKRFRRELIVCAVVAVGATLTTLVLGNILREIALETLENLRAWWAGRAARSRTLARTSMRKGDQPTRDRLHVLLGRGGNLLYGKRQ